MAYTPNNPNGQSTMANSSPVAIASDQTALPLSTGASTSALQTTQDTSINSLLKPASTLNAVSTVGTITNAVTVKADTPANQTNALKVDGSATTQPVSGNFVPLNTSASGTLTASDAVVPAPDGTGSIVSGASTAGSIVYLNIPDGFQSWTLLLKNYVSGTIYTEASLNTTNGTDGDWVDVKARRTGTQVGVESTTYAQVANGVYRGNGAGFKAIRARLIGGTGATVGLYTSVGAGAVFLNSGIPTGGSVIGKVGLDPSILGQSANASSLPVTVANEQVQSLSVTGGIANSATTAGASGFNLFLNTLSASSVDTESPVGYRSFYAQVNITAGTTGGQIIFEGSNDNANFLTLTTYDDSSVTGSPTQSTITLTQNTFRFFSGKTQYRYIRCRLVVAPTGTSIIQLFTVYKQLDYIPRINFLGTGTTLSAVTTLSTLTTLANGQTAHSSASTGSPLRIAGRVTATTPATQDQTLVAGDASDWQMTTAGQGITKPFSTAETDWQFACTAPVANTTDLVIKAASGTAGIRNYLTGFQIINSSATVATEVVIKDGATVIWRGFVGTSALLNSVVGVVFQTPLRGTGNTALNFACITTASAVYISAQGYTSF